MLPSPPPPSSLQPQRIEAYPKLAPLLPEGYHVYLNSDSSCLLLIDQNGVPCIAQPLSPSEFFVVATLIENYPDYCPHEVILSAITGKKIDWCRALVHASQEDGTVDAVMRPVRNLLGRVRIKLHPFGIDVKALQHTGYLLVPYAGHQR